MANQSNISMSLDPDIIEDIAAEMGISSAFVEKDWYAVQALKALAEHDSDEFQAIFSGGTSLSKGYGLIQGFSKDLDLIRLVSHEGHSQILLGFRPLRLLVCSIWLSDLLLGNKRSKSLPLALKISPGCCQSSTTLRYSPDY